MLLRKDDAGTILISQPAHAWLAGQMARAWGNEAFDRPDPCEPVCLGIEQHDIGWQDADRRPGYLPETGMPMEFWDLPKADHTRLWAEGVERAATLGRYPALLVSLHGTTIYSEKVDLDAASPADAVLIRRFVDGQRRFQAGILASLRADPRTAASAVPDAVERNRLLLVALDAISLHACWGLEKVVTLSDVPARARARTALTLRPAMGQPPAIEIDPWPFGETLLRLAVEGRRVSPPFVSAEALVAAYEAAHPTVVEILLRPRPRQPA